MATQAEEKVTHMFASIERQNLGSVVEKLATDMEHYKTYVSQLMRIRRMAYDAAIVEGFTPEQSLALCTDLAIAKSSKETQPR